MTGGSPYVPHDESETAAMLESVGADDVEELFDVPEAVRYDGDLGIEARSEPEIRSEVDRLLSGNDELTEFLGR